ncbi:MAG TPA: HD domain-containing phosphohydrolase [Thermoanaerobaculia bacterium]|nr:HD domain-containing phosphohydrolase [Thermoanaerobaculia bacterium]
MLPELRAIEPQLKQILYGTVEHVQATKAALYLSASHDLNEKTYELVTSYQFNDLTRKVVRATDDMVDRLAVRRAPVVVNGLGADQRFSEVLFRQGTDRLLATPLFSRGRLVGFIDMRDKAGRKPFEQPDIDAARRIADEVLAFLGTKGLFGLAPIPVAAEEPAAPAVMPQAATASAQTAALDPRFDMSPQAVKVIETARDVMTRRQLAHASGKHILRDSDLEIARLLLPAALAIPGAVFACFSAIGHASAPQPLVALATVTDDAMDMLLAHLHEWLTQNNQPNVTPRPQVVYPFGVQAVPVTAAGITSIITAPVNAQSVDGLVLTVGFERTPESQAQRGLQIFLRQIEQSVESAISSTSGRNERQIMAEKLLEPDFQRYAALVEHSRLVSVMAQRFATLLELPAQQVETIRLAAFLHDVGMRLLDYERLYRRPNLTAEQLRGVAEHPIVGAAIVEPLLGAEIALAILRHHERPDGKGYPSRMSGNAIPLASRIIQICDAWVTMTSANSYEAPLSPDVAATKLRDGAGTQFDEALVGRFLGAIKEIG